MLYLFKTTTTMKEYNNKKWWIDSKIITDLYINAENVDAALKEYKQKVNDKFYINISDNALKHKNEMYVDTENGIKQVGFVITGSTEFEDRNNYKCSKQYIDLWVNIYIVEDAFN